MNDLKRYKRIQELLDESKDPGFILRESNSEVVWRLRAKAEALRKALTYHIEHLELP